MNEPNVSHWIAAKRILRYLKVTINYGLAYTKGPEDTFEIIGYSDADWGTDKSDRKSRSGYCFLLNNNLVDWRSQKQTTIALSSFESEYAAGNEVSHAEIIGLVNALKEEMFLRQTINSIIGPRNSATKITIDNTAAIKNVLNPISTERTKHIAVNMHLIREQVKMGIIKPVYVPTAENVADLLTKGLSTELHYKHMRTLGLCPRVEIEDMFSNGSDGF
jgi:hypothetical protein